MGAIAVETLMAALYTNHTLRRAFLSDPRPVLDATNLLMKTFCASREQTRPTLAGSCVQALEAINGATPGLTFASYDRVLTTEIAPVRELFAIVLRQGIIENRG
jgi:hypothetical protein